MGGFVSLGYGVAVYFFFFCTCLYAIGFTDVLAPTLALALLFCRRGKGLSRVRERASC